MHWKTLALLTLASTSLAASQEAISNPRVARGDFSVILAGFYWNAHQEGLPFAVDVPTHVPIINPTPEEIHQLNQLIAANIERPSSSWEFGYKIGLSYLTSCDGWDLSLLWTTYKTHSSKHATTPVEANHTLIALWSAFSSAQGGANFARDIDTFWKLSLNLIDLTLGRSYWVSRRLQLHPTFGLRYGKIKQDLSICSQGGSWSPRANPDQEPLQGLLDIDNDYEGAGLLAGGETIWKLGCGIGVFGNFSTSILYGRFKIAHDEKNLTARPPFTTSRVLETSAGYRASRAIVDFALGIEWATQFCDCHYGIAARLGWEHHLFFDQNQMWQIQRLGNSGGENEINLLGENLFQQRRGTLDTQGWTLTLKIDF